MTNSQAQPWHGSARGRTLSSSRLLAAPQFSVERDMPRKSWTIIDESTSDRRGQTPFRAVPSDLQTSGSWSVTSQRYEAGIRAGVETISLNNGKLRLDVLPTRGMGIHAVHLAED